MAKLNVVIPAVNVTVDGVEYRKVERKAAAGDIVKITGEHSYVTTGEFYEVTRVDSAGDPHILDNDEDDYDLCGKKYEVYEKVVPTKRRLTVGDYARIVGENTNSHNYEQGSVVKIVGDDEDEAPYRAEKANGRTGNFLKERNVEPATEAEFLAQKQPQPSAEETDIIVHNGVRYRKVARKAEAGDLVIIIAEKSGHCFANGDVVTIKAVHNAEYVRALSTRSNSYLSYDLREYSVLEPISPQYREVKRKANVGERIRIVEPFLTGGKYGRGSEFVVAVVTSGGEGNVRVSLREGDDWFIAYSEYVVLEDAQEAPQPRRLKVGEYAKVTEKKYEYGVGDIVEITSIVADSISFDYGAKILQRPEHEGYVAESFIVRATDEEVAAAKAALDPRNKFAVGDKVRLVSGGDEWPIYGFKNGEVYEVSNPSTQLHNGQRIEIKREGASFGEGYAKPDQLVKVTAEELRYGDYVKGDRAVLVEGTSTTNGFRVGDYVTIGDRASGLHGLTITKGANQGYCDAKHLRKLTAEELAEEALTAKWAKIGRKVNEFKRGDIVRVIGEGAAGLRIGHIDEVTRVDSDGDVYFENTPNKAGKPFSFYVKRKLELVTPVEQRFDRAADGGSLS